MSTTIHENRNSGGVLLSRSEFDFLCILAAHGTAGLALALARSRLCGDTLADPDVEVAVVVEDHADGGRVGVGGWVGDGGGMGEGEDREEGQEEEGDGIHIDEACWVGEKLGAWVWPGCLQRLGRMKMFEKRGIAR